MRTGHPAVDVTLPITPMLDMSFQLLSFFILTFHPRPAEGQLAVTLPASVGVVAHEADPDSEPVSDGYTITLTETAGQLSIGFRGPTGAAAEVPSLAALRDALTALPKRTGTTVTIEAAPDLPYARLIAALDTIRKAGLDAIHITVLRPGPA
jgi:biopolymer transport protein ExbD